MNSSLSLLLPVHNSQHGLQANVQRVIDILPELTRRFEVLIIDDGSTDATCEVAYELARAYPQILVSRNARALGWARAVSAKAQEARGDFLMIHSGGELKPEDVVGLWRLRKGIAEAAAMRRSSRFGKLWRIDPKSPSGDDSHAALSVGDLSSRLGIHARAPGSNLLMVHRQQIGDLKRSLAALPNLGWPAAGCHAKASANGPVKRPSFLSRAKKFALEE